MYAFIDLETTGLDSVKHSITSIAILLNDKEFYIEIKPEKEISEEALKVQNKTIEDLNKGVDSRVALAKLLSFLEENTKGKRPIPVGYNVDFDIGFLKQFLKENGYEFNKLFSYQKIDILNTIRWFKAINMFNLGELNSLSLSNVCEHFDISLKAHNALEDIKATRTLSMILEKKVKEGEYKDEVYYKY